MSELTPAGRTYELYSQEAKNDPYPTFAAMRREAPIFAQPGFDGATMLWFVTRYEDVETLLRDDQRFARDERRAMPAGHTSTPSQLELLLNNHMLNKDGADHRRLRTLVSQAFTPARVRELRPRVQAIADELIDAVRGRGRMDLVADYAFHLPTIVISEMLGVPAAERERFKAWSSAFVTPAVSQAEHERAGALLQEFVDYLRAIFAARRGAPRDDLISALLRAEDAGDQLSEHELYSTVVLLIVAGHETTVSLIGNAALALLGRPELRRQLAQDPQLMRESVEEFLRFDSPVERALTRWATEDTTLGGQQIRRGDMLIGVLGSANRDASRFAEPDALDVSRGAARHLAFGHGAHYCLGAPLARLEGEVALGTLLRRLPGLRLDVPEGELVWNTVPIFRSLRALPVAW